MAKTRRNPNRSPLEDMGVKPLNLTPLLDIIFNLLFFFLLATTIREDNRYLEMNLPESTSAEARKEEEPLPLIEVSASGLALDGDPITEENLQAELIKRVEENKLTEVILLCDEAVNFQRVVTVTDICREAGIRQVTPQMKGRTE